jgi:outer membrane protein assembly factor BamA
MFMGRFLLAVVAFVTFGSIVFSSAQQATSKPQPRALVKVVSVKLEGADLVPEKLARQTENNLLFNRFPAANFEEQAREMIRVTLIRGGYRETTVEKLTVSAVGAATGPVREVAVAARVSPGEQYHISGVAIEGVEAETVTPQEVRDLIPFHPGDAVDTYKMLAGLAEIRKLYACRGYLKAEPVPIVDGHRATRTEYLTIDMREGKEYEVSSVKLEGFSDGTADRLLTAPGLQTGEKFSLCKIRDSEKELLGPTPVRIVMELTTDDEAGKVGVVFHPARENQWDGEVINHTTGRVLF